MRNCAEKSIKKHGSGWFAYSQESATEILLRLRLLARSNNLPCVSETPEYQRRCAILAEAASEIDFLARSGAVASDITRYLALTREQNISEIHIEDYLFKNGLLSPVMVLEDYQRLINSATAHLKVALQAAKIPDAKIEVTARDDDLTNEFVISVEDAALCCTIGQQLALNLELVPKPQFSVLGFLANSGSYNDPPTVDEVTVAQNISSLAEACLKLVSFLIEMRVSAVLENWGWAQEEQHDQSREEMMSLP